MHSRKKYPEDLYDLVRTLAKIDLRSVAICERRS